MRLSPLRLPLAIVLALAPSLRAAEPPATQPDPTEEDWARKYPPKPGDVARVMVDLTKEAVTAWRNNDPWPRDRSNYARQMNLSLPNADLIRILSQRLQSNPALDAYIKWQLLSFHPDLAGQSIKTYRQIIATLPDLLRQPQPTIPDTSGGGGGGGGYGISMGTQMAIVNSRITNGQPGYHLGVITAGSGLAVNGAGPSGGITTTQDIIDAVQTTQAETNRIRGIIDAANVPALAVRTRLAALLPREGGVRLLALIDDCLARMGAADPSWPDAMERLVAEAKAMGQGTPLDPDLKPMIVGGLRQLIEFHQSNTRSVWADNTGRIGTDREVIFAPRQALAHILEALNLREVLQVPLQ